MLDELNSEMKTRNGLKHKDVIVVVSQRNVRACACTCVLIHAAVGPENTFRHLCVVRTSRVVLTTSKVSLRVQVRVQVRGQGSGVSSWLMPLSPHRDRRTQMSVCAGM